MSKEQKIVITPEQMFRMEIQESFRAIDRNLKSYTAHLNTSQMIIIGMARLLKISPQMLADAINDEGANKKYENDVVTEIKKLADKLEMSKSMGSFLK